MKMKNRGDGFCDDELVVADILLQLPELISDRSRPLNSWSIKRKRSDIDQYLSSSTTCRDVLSPTTPLSFFPTKLDRKCKRIKIFFKKKQEISKTVDDLTHQRGLLKYEIGNVKRLRNKVKALNSESKTEKQQCNLDMAMGEGGVVESGEQQVHIPQPLQLFPCHPDRTFAEVASTYGSVAANPTGPYGTPQINVSLNENLELNLDLSLNNISLNADTALVLKRTEAAQARKKRLQICKVKKPKGGSNHSIPKKACFIH